MLFSIENYRNCDFQGRGSGPPIPSLDLRIFVFTCRRNRSTFAVCVELGGRERSFLLYIYIPLIGGQWFSGRVLDLRSGGRGFEPHQRHCGVSLSKTH